MTIALEPIGYVRNPHPARPPGGWSQAVARVDLHPHLLDHLDGLEEFSHLLILYWMHLLPAGGGAAAQVQPRGRSDLPWVGVLATRAPARPNPIGLTVVELLQREGTCLTVRGLDALDGSPVLDIKPQLPPPEEQVPFRYPEWVWRLREERDD